MTKVFYTNSLLISIIVFFLSPCYSGEIVQVVIQPAAKKLLESRGYCKTKSTFIDLNDYFFLKERKIELNKGINEKTLEIEGEKIYISKIDKKSNERLTAVYAVDERIEDRADLDIDLTLAFTPKLDDVVVYWRETFKYKSYRQGLVKISKDNIQLICEGRGGVDSTH